MYSGLMQRTTGETHPDIAARFPRLDRAGLLNVTAATEVMQEAARADMASRSAAEREQVRPASQIESRIADIADQAARLGATVLEDATGRRVDRVEALADHFRPEGERQTHTVSVHGQEAFAARLEEAGIAIVRVTETDTRALAALREQEEFDRASGLAHQPRHFADLVVGDLAAVTRNGGDVFRINPDKCSDAKRFLAADLPGVVETRARFEIEGEKITALWDQQRAAGAEARQDFAADRESHAQHAQTARDVGQFNQEMDAAADTGFKAARSLLGSIGSAITSVIGWLADSIAPPPPPTRDQAERMMRTAEEKQEQQAAAARQQAEQEFILREMERSRQSADQRPTTAELYGTPKPGGPARDNERDRDRDYEREL